MNIHINPPTEQKRTNKKTKATMEDETNEHARETEPQIELRVTRYKKGRLRPSTTFCRLSIFKNSEKEFFKIASQQEMNKKSIKNVILALLVSVRRLNHPRENQRVYSPETL